MKKINFLYTLFLAGSVIQAGDTLPQSEQADLRPLFATILVVAYPGNGSVDNKTNRNPRKNQIIPRTTKHAGSYKGKNPLDRNKR